MPYCWQTFIGEAFQKCQVEVHYSVIDNDDTLATYAHQYGAIVMSNDKDFFRYEPSVPTIISDYDFNKKG